MCYGNSTDEGRDDTRKRSVRTDNFVLRTKRICTVGVESLRTAGSEKTLNSRALRDSNQQKPHNMLFACILVQAGNLNTMMRVLGRYSLTITFGACNCSFREISRISAADVQSRARSGRRRAPPPPSHRHHYNHRHNLCVRGIERGRAPSDLL